MMLCCVIHLIVSAHAVDNTFLGTWFLIFLAQDVAYLQLVSLASNLSFSELYFYSGLGLSLGSYCPA